MSITEALVLGIIQGITEFLPVSSSGHLVLLQSIFGIKEPVLLFNIMVHVGTLAAVCTVLWKDIWNLLCKIIQPLTLLIIIGTIPAVIAALFIKDLVEQMHATTFFLGFAFLITSALLVFSELFYKNPLSNTNMKETAKTEPALKERSKFNALDALVIGIFQAIAITPGISRSGSTLAAGFFRGLSRDMAVRFSFLLSIPAILGALLMELLELRTQSSSVFGNIGAAPMIIGAVSAAIVGFFSVRLMLKIVRERSLLGFAIYTGILGILVIIDCFGTKIFL